MHIEALFYLDHEAYSVFIRLVPEIGYALQSACLYHLGHILDELGLVHLIGKLFNDYLSALVLFLDLLFGLKDYAAPPGLIGGINPASSHDIATCRKVRSRQIKHQIAKRGLWLVYEMNYRFA